MKAIVTTRHVSALAAKSIETALRVDSRTAPNPLHITSRLNGRQVTSTITGAQDVESLLTTIDDLLLCLVTADKVLPTIEAMAVERRVRRRPADSGAPKV